MSSEGKEGAIELGKLTNSASIDDKNVNTLGSNPGDEKGKITDEGAAKDELIAKEDLDKHVEVK